MCKVLLNEELNGIELYFTVKPETTIREEMKLNGFRWNGKKSCWYAKQTEKAVLLSEKLQGEKVEISEAPKHQRKKNNIDLWALVQYKKEARKIIYCTKTIAKELRTHLKSRFPFVKFSIRTNGNSINCDIISSPFEKESSYLLAIKKYCVDYANSYNYDNSDTMTDYFDVNFYGGYFDVDWNYKKIEATTELTEAMKNYDIKEEEKIKLDKIEEEKKYQEYLKEQEEREQQYILRIEEEKKQIEYINNNIEVVEIEEEKKYYIVDANFANLNKNSTLQEYKEEVEKGKFYKNSLKVTREIHFKDSESLNYFESLLLNDFDFITGTGGSYTEDLRINSMIDYNKMSDTERKSVEWLLSGIAIYLDGKIQFIVDAQGYSYARYVGLIDENTRIEKTYNYNEGADVEEIEELKMEASEIIEVYNNIVVEGQEFNYQVRKNVANEIKKNCLLNFEKAVVQQVENIDIKKNLYTVLEQNDTIKDQIKENNFYYGQQLTMIKLSMIGGVSISKIIFNDIEEQDENIKMIIGLPNKKGQYQSILKDNEEILIYKNWVNIDSSVLYKDTSNDNFKGSQTKYGSYDRNAMDAVIEYLKEKNILPAINTYKPVF